MSSYIIGVDTGGTFTDTVALDERGNMWRAKALSEPPKFEKGIINSLERLANTINISIEELLSNTDAFCFGTTVATNALWTRTGSKVGVLITRGFEDTHHIARGLSKWAGLPEAEIKHISALRKSEPLLPKTMVAGIDERIDWQGRVICPLNVKQVEKEAKTLIDNGAESIAVCYLWAAKNAQHEIESSKILSKLYPDIYNSYSSKIMPTEGEYERFNNAIVDAYIGPVTVRFLDKLSKMLKKLGLKCELVTMKANGGTALISGAAPLTTIHSGPAAGVVGAQFIGGLLGYENIITADVGGTSFDTSVIVNGKLIYTREPTLEKFSVSYPSLDVKSIGAGGGSIAWVEPVTKTLNVGPKSAGARPGPACYGFGGTNPTVTDADLIMGYLNPDFFLGGAMKLYPDKAHKAIKKIADDLEMNVIDTASGIYRIVNAHCTDLIRATTVQRGFDPRGFALFVFGGCGPLHAVEWAIELGVEEVVISPFASEYSAFGIAIGDILQTKFLYDYAAMPMDVNRFNQNYKELENQIMNEFSQQGIHKDAVDIRYFLHCKYPTVYGDTKVPIPRKEYVDKDMDGFISSRFDEEYELMYGKASAMKRAGREIVGFEIEGRARRSKPFITKNEKSGSVARKALKTDRDAYFPVLKKFTSTHIYDYSRLEAGNTIEGPAIIETIDTSIVIPPGSRGKVDEYLNVIVKVV